MVQCYCSLEKINDPAYHVRIHLVTFDFDMAIVDFLTLDDASNWEFEYNRVKTLENAVRTHSDVNQMSLAEKKDLFRDVYIPATVAFAQKWGAEMVPADVRFSISDVRAATGMAVTNWPPINYTDKDGTVQAPSDVDDLGRCL